MGLLLVPIGDRSNVVHERLVLPVGPPSESLYGHAEVFIEKDGIHDVPPIQTPFGRTIVARMFQHVADVGRAVEFREAVTTAQVVFGPGPANRRELSVPVDIELDFTFAEPAIG